MEAAHFPWRPLGELFVERGLISEEQLEDALAEQAATGQRLGEILVGQKLISSPELTQTLMEQLGREVAKEEGFGSGLWSEIKRRQSRAESPPELSLVEDDRPPVSQELSEALGEPLEEPPADQWLRDQLGLQTIDNSTIAELEQDLEELRSELDVVPLQAPSAAEAGSHDALSASELEEAGRALHILDTTMEQPKTESENAGSGLSAHGVAELEAALHERDARIEELQSLLAENRLERDASGESLALLEARAADAEQELLAARAAHSPELEQRVEVVQDRVTELEGQLSTQGGRVAAADAALVQEREAHTQTRQQLEEAVVEAGRVREMVPELERGLDALRVERDTARDELDEARVAIAGLEEQMSEHGDARAAADAALAQEREAHGETRRRAEAAAAEAADARAAFERELESARENSGVADAALVQEREAHTQTRQQLEEAVVDAGRVREMVPELERGLDALRVERDTARDELDEARVAIAGLEEQMSEHGDARAAADAALAQEREAHGETRRRAEAAAAEAADARAAFERELESARENSGVADAALVQEREAHTQTRDRLHVVESEFETAESERDSASAELEGERAAATELNGRISELAGQLADAQAQLERKRQAKADLKRQLEIVEGRVIELEGRLSTQGERVAAADAALVQEREAHTQTRDRLHVVESEFETAESERDSASAELEGERAAATELNGRVSELAGQLADAQAQLERKRQAKADLEQGLTDAEARAMELEQRASTIAERLAASQSALTQERDAHQSTRRRVEQASSDLDDAEATIRAGEERYAELAAEVATLVEEQAELFAATSAERATAALRLSSLEARLAEEAASHVETRRVLAQAIDELTGHSPDPAAGDEDRSDQDDYLCFASSEAGYRLVVCTGRVPTAGTPYELDGVEFAVTRVGRSPLPFDRRRCVYLQAIS